MELNDMKVEITIIVKEEEQIKIKSFLKLKNFDGITFYEEGKRQISEKYEIWFIEFIKMITNW